MISLNPICLIIVSMYIYKWISINQSVNQSINQSINQNLVMTKEIDTTNSRVIYHINKLSILLT